MAARKNKQPLLAWGIGLSCAGIILVAGVQIATTETAQSAALERAAQAGSCASDPSGPEITGHNQVYEHHWIRNGERLEFEILSCDGGAGPLDIWWEVNENFVQSGSEFQFGSYAYGRGIHSVDAYCMDSAGFCAHQHFHVEVFDEDAFTIAFLPDTQYYTKPGRSQIGGPGSGNPQMFYDQMEWIVASRQTLDIVWTAHLGDVVEGCCSSQQCTPPQSDTPPAECFPVQCPVNPEDPPYNPSAEEMYTCQWARGNMAMEQLEEAGIPYSIAVGNHDYFGSSSDVSARDLDIFDSYFPPSRWGSMVSNVDHYEAFGIFEDENMTPPVENTVSSSYHLFTAGGLGFLLIAHEYEPRPEVREWVLDLIESHPERRVLVTRHSNTSPSASDYPNVFFHAWGHDISNHGNSFATASSNIGTPAYRMMVNYQFQDYGGNGYLRFLVFEPDRNLITARTYSPYRELNPHQDYPPVKPNGDLPSPALRNFDFPYIMSSESVPVITVAGAGGLPGSSLAVHLSGTNSFSYDSTVTITDFQWNFGDGQTAAGMEVEHLYDEPGLYTVELAITNSLQQNSSWEVAIEVPFETGVDWHGDANRDGIVDVDDIEHVIEFYGDLSTDDVVGTGKFDEYDMLSVLCNWGRIITDINRDCVVDVSDLLLLSASGGGCPWPCPADIGRSIYNFFWYDIVYGPDGVVNYADRELFDAYMPDTWGHHPGCDQPPGPSEMSMAAPFLMSGWLTFEGELDTSACELLPYWYANPAYD